MFYIPCLQTNLQKKSQYREQKHLDVGIWMRSNYRWRLLDLQPAKLSTKIKGEDCSLISRPLFFSKFGHCTLRSNGTLNNKNGPKKRRLG